MLADCFTSILRKDHMCPLYIYEFSSDLTGNAVSIRTRRSVFVCCENDTKNKYFVGFEVITAVVMKNSYVLRDITPCVVR
jgi:hypothetical protein